MLVLSRKRDERVLIGDNIVVTVVEVMGDKVRLGFEAPSDVPIKRQEIADRERAAVAAGTTTAAVPQTGSLTNATAHLPRKNEVPSHPPIRRSGQ
jgi:carbon storage regulator